MPARSFQGLGALRYLRMGVARSARAHNSSAILGTVLALSFDLSCARHDTQSPWVPALRVGHATPRRIAGSARLSGVVLKAIDPVSSAKVTELSRQIDVGGLDYLAHPEKLKTLGGPAVLKEEDQPPGPKDSVKLGRRTVPGVIIGRELAKNL